MSVCRGGCRDTHSVFWGAVGRDALEGKGVSKAVPKAVRQAVEGVAKAVGGGYCRLPLALRMAVAVRETVAGHRLGIGWA